MVPSPPKERNSNQQSAVETTARLCNGRAAVATSFRQSLFAVLIPKAPALIACGGNETATSGDSIPGESCWSTVAAARGVCAWGNRIRILGSLRLFSSKCSLRVSL